MKIKNIVLLTALGLGFSIQAQAGPFILAGTDADDHGSASATANNSGWLFMQRALENLTTSASLNNGFLNVVNLGSEATRRAGLAAASAFGKSSLSGVGGWSFSNIDTDAAITNFLAGKGAVNVNNTGIIMMDSGGNVSGGSSSSEKALFTLNATAIDKFLGGGGGLFS